MSASRTPPGQRADQRRNDELILRTAARLLAADPGTSLRAIADAAGLARPTVYRRYPTREALVAGIRAAATEDMMAALEAVGAWTDNAEAFRTLLRALVRMGQRYPIILARHQIDSGDRRSPVDQRMVTLLSAGQNAGVLRTDVDPDLLNAAIFGTLSSIVALHPGAEPDGLADLITGLLLQGITANAGRSAPPLGRTTAV